MKSRRRWRWRKSHNNGELKNTCRERSGLQLMASGHYRKQNGEPIWLPVLFSCDSVDLWPIALGPAQSDDGAGGHRVKNRLAGGVNRKGHFRGRGVENDEDLRAIVRVLERNGL